MSPLCSQTISMRLALRFSRFIGYIASDDMMTDDLEGSGHSIIKTVYEYLFVGTEQNHEKTVRIWGVPAEIRTERISNVSIARYRYGNPAHNRVCLLVLGQDMNWKWRRNQYARYWGQTCGVNVSADNRMRPECTIVCYSNSAFSYRVNELHNPSICLSVCLSVCGSTAFVDLGLFFSFLIYTQSVEPLWRGLARRKAATYTQNNTNTE
jgi:hypothetical protein